VPCWVLVPSKPAWRYGVSGDKMLFYPSVRMYRQAEGEDWSNVLQRVNSDFAELTEEQIAA
jgi:hypothetical protein